MHVNIVLPLACQIAFFNGRGFAENHFGRSWSVSENAHNPLNKMVYVKDAYSLTFDLLILGLMFLFFKNTVKKLKFRYAFYQFRKS